MSEYDPTFRCPDCGATEKELDTHGHKPKCPNPQKAKKLLQSFFGDFVPITQR